VLFAFTADHGETWGDSLPDDCAVEHMYDLHGRWLTDETTHVPLLLWGKGVDGPIPAGQHVGGFARGVDLAPTLCALAGVPWPGPIPTHDGPTLVDRGIGERGDGLDLDGVSLAESVRRGCRTPVQEALTVTSHNAIVPARYPKSGRRMWSRFALRTETRRYTWDGLFGLRDVQDLGAPPAAGRVRRLKDRLVDLPRIWGRLADERASALGPTTKLPRELYPRFRASSDEEDDGGLEEQLRMLGYTGD
jgi:arylsulfatase A-like enzyme